MTSISEISNSCVSFVPKAIEGAFVLTASGLSAWFFGEHVGLTVLGTYGTYLAHKIYNGFRDKPLLSKTVDVLPVNKVEEKKSAPVTKSENMADVKAEEKKETPTSKWRLRGKVAGNGNCLFASVAEGLLQQGQKITPQEMRSNVVKWMTGNYSKDPQLQTLVFESIESSLQAKQRRLTAELNNLTSITNDREALSSIGFESLGKKFPMGVPSPNIDLGEMLVKEGLAVHSEEIESKKKETSENNSKIGLALSYFNSKISSIGYKNLVNDYFAEIAQSGTFGSVAEIYAMSQIYKIEIIVEREGLSSSYNRSIGAGSDSKVTIEHSKRGDHFDPVYDFDLD